MFGKYLQFSHLEIGNVACPDKLKCDEKMQQHANYFIDNTVSTKSAKSFDSILESITDYTLKCDTIFTQNNYRTGSEYLVENSEGRISEYEIKNYVAPSGGKGDGLTSKEITTQLFSSKQINY